MAHVRLSMGLAVLSGACLSACVDNAPANDLANGYSGAAGASSGTAGTTNNTAGTTQADAADEGACATACPMGATCMAGVCQCPDYAPDTCDDKCVNKKIDVDHCGACTTKCDPGATCNAAACGPKPAVVVAQAAGCDALHLALANNVLYWTDKMHGTVMSMPTAGGAATTIAMTQGGPGFIAVDATNAYWINTTDKKVMKSLLPMGAPATLATSPAVDGGMLDIQAITVFGSTLYFSAGDHIYKVPTAGGTSTLVGIAQQSGIPGSLAADANQIIYPTHIHSDVEIMQLSADAGATTRVAESQGSLFYDTIILANGTVYWANGARVLSGVPSGEKNSNTVINSAEIGNVTGFAIGTANVYFGEDGFVEKGPLPLDGGQGEDGIKIARDQKSPTSFVLDSSKVYWASDCAILSTAQ